MKKENLKSTLVASASFLILLDRPIQYIFECLISVTLPTNRLVVIIALVIFSLDKKINLSKRDISFLILTISSFIIGTIILPEYKTSDVIAAIGVIFPFYIGNKLVELDNNKVGKTFLAVNALIFFILFLVVTGLGGNIFELKYQLHMIGLILEKRPEIFTDQNFQILYLLSPPLILLFSKSNKYKLVVAITMLLYLYSLNFVQSRTGFIFYVLFILSIIFIMKEKNKLKLLISGFIISIMSTFLILTLNSHIIENFAIYERFTSHTNSTAGHRLHSLMFVFERLFYLEYWLPNGSYEFSMLYGGKPHSNITAFYLVGGILGLIGYIALIVQPIIKLWLKFKTYRTDRKILIVIATTVLIAQLTLNLPFNEQVWFWAGLSIGILKCSKKEERRRY